MVHSPSNRRKAVLNRLLINRLPNRPTADIRQLLLSVNPRARNMARQINHKPIRLGRRPRRAMSTALHRDRQLLRAGVLYGSSDVGLVFDERDNLRASDGVGGPTRNGSFVARISLRDDVALEGRFEGVEAGHGFLCWLVGWFEDQTPPAVIRGIERLILMMMDRLG